MQIDEAIRITRQAAEDAKDLAKRQRSAGLKNFARIEREKARAFEMVCNAVEISRSIVNTAKFPPDLTGDGRNGTG